MIQKSLQVILYIIFLLTIVFFAFRSLFSLENSAVWGDAPYFYNQAMFELWDDSYSWTNGVEPAGGVNKAVWISPLMAVWGGLYRLLNLDSTLIIKLLFYFPAILLAALSSYLFARHLKLSPLSCLLAASLYVLNTYFILLVDGGQVGIALAFGIFPLAVLFLKLLLEKFTLPKFLFSLGIYFLLTIADARFVFIALLTVLIWQITISFFSRKLPDWPFLGRYLVFCAGTLLVGLYWILPTLVLTSGEIVSASQSEGIQLANFLLLFQPHWPENIFGRLNQPPFYFLLFPVLVFLSLVLRRNTQVTMLAVVLVIFIFLAKGTAPPLGEVYNFIVTLPYGFAFRDATKFFAPVLLFSGVLIGFSYDYVAGLQRNLFFTKLLPFFFLGFLVVTIYPAIQGQMNGVLAGRLIGDEFSVVASTITKRGTGFRSLWFPEKHPFGLESRSNPAIDARLLVGKRPFASLNVGTDPFNFLHNSLASEFLGLLAVKHLIMSGDFRNPHPSVVDQKDWEELVGLVENNPEFKRLDLQTTFPVLENKQVLPRVFKTDKLVAVVGGDDIYPALKNAGLLAIQNQVFLFLEDGKFDPDSLFSVLPSNLMLVLNKKSSIDLQMTFLGRFFLKETPRVQEWAQRKSSEYLKYKYELLTKGLESQEYDYAQDIYFSTQDGERIVYPLKVNQDGEYILAVRHMGLDSVLELTLGGHSGKIKTAKNFAWFAKQLNLKSGKHDFAIVNQEGLSIVSAVALVPLDQWEESGIKTRSIVEKFPVFDIENQNDVRKLVNTLNTNTWVPLDYRQNDSVRFALENPGSSWIVFSESFHPDWVLKNNGSLTRALPGYSMLNVFYAKRGGSSIIYFAGQKYLRLGKYLSVMFGLGLWLFIFWPKKETFKKN